MKYYQTKRFKDLHSRWTERLVASGFEDIESGNHRGTEYQDLRQRQHWRQNLRELKIAYYDWAREQMLKPRFRFVKPLHKAIWKLHCDGYSMPEIGRMVGFSRWTIEDILKELEDNFKRRARR